MPPTYTRQTAIPCSVGELRSGTWLQNTGIAPSGVQTARGLLSRVSIIGVIVDNPDDGSFMIDDGSGTIRVRTFDAGPTASKTEVGNLVLVIGRLREYSGERYIGLEICKAVSNPAWATYRKKEIEYFAENFVVEENVAQSAQREADSDSQTAQISVHVPESAPKNPFERIIGMIKELDDGSGAPIDDVLAKVQHPDAKRITNTLLEEGEIFEIKPGRVKVLE